MKILVINENDDAHFRPFVDRYQLFNDWDKAVAAAKEIGWEDPYGFGLNKKVGMGNVYQCQPIKVTIMALEEQ